MNILITGATGLIGRALTQLLATEGHSIKMLSRRPHAERNFEAYQWDLLSGPLPAEAIEGADAVIHLAGEPIASGRWDAELKKRIRDSRVIGTRNLVAGLRSARVRPNVLVSASAVGYYGDRGDEMLDENSAPGQGFLSDVCIEWEHEAAEAKNAGLRVASVRTATVLSRDGGALTRMLPAFRLGIAGKLGGGDQWFPWIHIDDITGIYRHILINENVQGPVNGVAPGNVTNAEFTRELAAVLHRPAFLPVPTFALNLLFGEIATAILASQRVSPCVALEAGYRFRFATLQSVLKNLLANDQRAD